jgi:hypothetical protein
VPTRCSRTRLSTPHLTSTAVSPHPGLATATHTGVALPCFTGPGVALPCFTGPGVALPCFTGPGVAQDARPEDTQPDTRRARHTAALHVGTGPHSRVQHTDLGARQSQWLRSSRVRCRQQSTAMPMMGSVLVPVAAGGLMAVYAA